MIKEIFRYVFFFGQYAQVAYYSNKTQFAEMLERWFADAFGPHGIPYARPQKYSKGPLIPRGEILQENVTNRHERVHVLDKLT